MEDDDDIIGGMAWSDLQEVRTQLYEGSKMRPAETALQRFARKELHAKSDVAERFHEATKLHTETVRPGQRTSIRRFTNNETLAFATCDLPPDYRHHETVPLPAPTECQVSLGRALETRRSRRTYTGDGISKQTLSNLLYYGCGEVAVEEFVSVAGLLDDDEQAVGIHRRTSPSPGGLYSIEPYVIVVNAGPDTRRGVYHYSASTHSLHRLEDDGSFGPEHEAVWNDPDGEIEYDDAAVWMFLTGAFGRITAKYGPRGYRLLLNEAGHLCQNLHLVATARGLSAVPVAAYCDDPANEMLGVNGVDEGVVHALVLGVPDGGEGDE